jgi:hypothetical protein
MRRGIGSKYRKYPERLALEGRCCIIADQESNKHRSSPERFSMSSPESATRQCPYCKEVIHSEAIRCKHCQTNLAPGVPAGGGPQAYGPYGTAVRQRFRKAPLLKRPEPLAAACPPAILDTAPDGSGLGVWILVASDDESCTYEYGGGIA